MCLNSKSLCAREPIEPNSIWRSQLDDPYFRGVPVSLSPLLLPPFHVRNTVTPSSFPPSSPLPCSTPSSFSPSCVHNGDTIDFEAQSIVTRSSRRKRHGSPLHRLWMAHTRDRPSWPSNPGRIRALSPLSLGKAWWRRHFVSDTKAPGVLMCDENFCSQRKWLA